MVPVGHSGLTPVDFLQLRLRFWSAITVNTQTVIDLKLFNGRHDQPIPGVVRFARVVAEIVKASPPSGQFVNRIKVADLNGDYKLLERESRAFRRRRNELFNHSFTVCRQLVDLALDFKLTGRGGNGLAIQVSKHKPKHNGWRFDFETMGFCGGAGDFLEFFFGNEQLIAGEQNVRVRPFLFQRGIVGMIPNSTIVVEAILLRDSGDMLPLFDTVRWHSPA